MDEPRQPAPLDDDSYRLMVEAVSDYAIFFMDPAGHVLSWNPGVRRLKGYEAHEIIGRHFSVFYPPDMVARGWPDYELKVAAETGRFEDEGWRVRKDGSRFWANIVITKLVDRDGRFRGFSKIARDLTERRNQQELLRLSEERFRLLVDGVHDYAIFMLDTGGRIMSWNSGAQKAKGYTADEVIGRHFSIFYPPDVAASGWPEKELKLAMISGRYEEEGWRVRKGHTKFWASVVITTLYDANGVHIGFAKVTRDLTDRRRISTLEDEGRRISTFLAMLGHELRNPLAPISYALAALQREPSRPPDVVRSHEVIGRQLKQLSRLVDDLLEVGRIVNGKIHLEAVPTRLADAVLEAVEAMAPVLKAKGHELRLAVDADADIWVQGDPLRLVQIVGNLLGNAAKFTPPGGSITVALRAVGANAELRIQDNGVGIDAELLPDVFKLFVQGRQTPGRPQGGLGLGLTLVQQLVTLHGGDVEAFSTGVEGQGSEFVVRLPRTKAPPAVMPADAAPPRHAAAIRLMVVDDNQDAADTLSALLRAEGYRVETLYDGVAAARAIVERRPDAAILDIGLPGLSGFEVAGQVRAAMERPPILIALTGYGLPADREAALDAGFAAHRTKPVDHAELLTLLGELFPDTP